MAHFASAVKTDWGPEAEGLLEHACRIAEIARERLEAQGLADDDGLTNLRASEVRQARAALRSLPDRKMKLLLTNCISPLPLHKTLILLECLAEHRHEQYHSHLLLALAQALVFSISNLHFGPEVGVEKPKDDAAVICPWLGAVQAMARDLSELRPMKLVPASVHCADARQAGTLLDRESIDAVITSPPYPNEKDYTRTTRLESVLLGFVEDKAQLRSLKRTLVRSNTRGVYKADADDSWVSKHAGIQAIARAIERRRLELHKTSGFERLYARVTKLYFGGMARHFADLRRALRPGAQLAYVVGDQASYLRVMIRTGQILAEIAESLGYEVLGVDLFRTRLATATRQHLREEVVVLRWPGGG